MKETVHRKVFHTSGSGGGYIFTESILDGGMDIFEEKYCIRVFFTRMG